MNYFEILREALVSFSFVDLLRFLGLFAFGVSSGMAFKFTILDFKAKIPFVALSMFVLALISMGVAISIGLPFFSYPIVEIRITTLIILAIFFVLGFKDTQLQIKQLA